MIVLVRLVHLAGITRFASVISAYLGTIFTGAYSTAGMKEALGAAALAALVTLIAQLVQGELEYQCNAEMRTSLRSKIFEKVLELDAGNIEKIGPVSAVTASVDAAESILIYYSRYLPSLVFSLIAPVYLFFRLKNISLSVAWILLAVSLVLLPLHNVFRSRIEALRKGYWGSLEDMTAYYLDSIRGLTTLKLFDRDQEHAEILSEKAEVLNTNINKFMKVNFTSFLVTEGMIYTAILISCGIAAASLKNGSMDLGGALTILMLSYSYFGSVRQLMSATHSALTAISAAGKVEEILETDTSRVYDPGLPKEEETGIRMEHVSFRYAGRNITLKDVSLKIEKGKVTAFAGLSGCGKSTAASLLMRFMDPEQGRILIDGRDYRSLRPEEVRRQIVMVPQTVTIFSGTIRDNLLLAAPEASEEAMREALRQVRLDTFADHLDADAGENGAKLSGGQKQKIGIVRALLSNAEYMIFDEATSSVDPESENEIWECIENLSKVRTLIIISHRLSTIEWADRIYILEQGKITEEGNHTELMKNNGLYRQLVTEQARLYEEAAR